MSGMVLHVVTPYARNSAFNINELKNISVLNDIEQEVRAEIISLWKNNHYEVIAENWHVQMFQEFGIIGGIVYLILMFQFLFYLYTKSKKSIYGEGAFLALGGLVVAGMFLHSFEDASTSLSLFLLIGLVE